MTRFEKDLESLQNDQYADNEVYRRREAEIAYLRKQGKAAHNQFRIQCVAQELVQRERELNTLYTIHG
ncbi:hypothetical protein AGMMS49992_31110 [Clostridia bacterium]|nr:hypothetical protein AGMMS49992_31110 [Clostridia bacterium]